MALTDEEPQRIQGGAGVGASAGGSVSSPSFPHASRLWEQFQGLVWERVAVLEQAAGALADGSLQEPLRQQAEREAHRLAGGLGCIGFPEGTRIAREIEGLLHRTGALRGEHVPHLCTLVAALREALPEAPA